MNKLGVVLLGMVLSFGVAESNEDTPSNSLFINAFDVGVQILPNYNEDGQNEGFDRTRMYANINIDARWKNRINRKEAIHNLGIDIKFLGTANDSNQSLSSLVPSSFDNVSDTVDISFYYQYIPSFTILTKSKNLYSEIGIITHAGIRSRKAISLSNDTVNYYGDIGIKYSYFQDNPYSDVGISENLPDFYMGAYIREYSDYNGFNNTERYIFDFKYKVSSEYNVFIGAEANLGEEEDEIYLTLTLRNDFLKLFDLFK